jgi:hypothetical protein
VPVHARAAASVAAREVFCKSSSRVDRTAPLATGKEARRAALSVARTRAPPLARGRSFCARPPLFQMGRRPREPPPPAPLAASSRAALGAAFALAFFLALLALFPAPAAAPAAALLASDSAPSLRGAGVLGEDVAGADDAVRAGAGSGTDAAAAPGAVPAPAGAPAGGPADAPTSSAAARIAAAHAARAAGPASAAALPGAPAAPAAAAAPAARPPSRRAPGMLSLGVAPLPPSPALPPPEGQVSAANPFGAALHRLAALPSVRTVLELGTWRGGGSSTRLADGLLAGDALQPAGAAEPSLLVTVEAEPEMHAAARAALAGKPVRLLLGSTVAAADLPTADEAAALGGVPGVARAEWEAWLAGERASTARHPGPPLLPTLCADFDWDLIHLDAGEFMGDAEWRVVRDACTSARFIAIHDTQSYKNRRVLAELLAAPQQWALVARGDPPAEAAGWAIFERAAAEGGTQARAQARVR